MSRTWLSAKLTFLWLAVGYGVLHAIVGGWCLAIIGSAFPSSPSEHLQMTVEGEPVIMQYWNNSSEAPRYRRLDGTPLNELEVSRVKLDSPVALSRLVGEPHDWEDRLDTLIDFRSPSTNWYFVAPFDHPGTAYFQGHEQFSKRLIGYIGKKGFTSSLPERDERFAIVPSLYNAFSGILVATQKPYPHAQVYEPGSNFAQNHADEFANVPQDAVWILSQGTLYEIHLGDRTVRALSENHPDWQSLSRTVVKDGDRSLLQLVARTEQGIDLIIPGTETRNTIPLEPASPFANELFYQLPDGRRLLTRTSRPHGLKGEVFTEILWFNDSGSVERREMVALVNSSTSESAVNAAFLTCAPSPVVSLGALVIAPVFNYIPSPETAAYLSRLAEFFVDYSPWILLTLLIGLITGWAAWRRERQIFHSQDWTWPILVGLGGWFGWIAYICLKPLPARLPNRQRMPAQPEPNRPLGTEIFA